ncbi:hypothetical protein BH20ACT17_BH20ACT17_01570 [soil metagenome]
MPIWARIAALLVAVALALPAAAGAQTPAQTQSVPAQEPGSSRPPVDLGNSAGNGASSNPPSSAAQGELPNTGSDPRLLFLTGLALTLLGVGLRLRTADADVY